MVPDAVTLHPDGFEVEIRGRRAEERAVATMVTLFGVGALAMLALVGPAASLQRMLGMAVWGLVAVIGLLGLQIAIVAFAPVRRTALSLSSFTLRLGGQRIPVGEIAAVKVRRGTLVIEAGTRHVVPASHTPADVCGWVRDRLVERSAKWRARDGRAPPEIEALRQ